MITHNRLREVITYDPETGIFVWRVGRQKCKAGAVAGRINIGYVEIMIDGKMYLGHRLAWFYVHGVWPDGNLDHKNLIRSANWIDNLRPATVQQNGYNRGAARNNKLSTKGVCVRPGGRYQAQICIEGKNTYLGMFDTPELAHAAYRAEAEKHHGEFLHLEGSKKCHT